MLNDIKYKSAIEDCIHRSDKVYLNNESDPYNTYSPINSEKSFNRFLEYVEDRRSYREKCFSNISTIPYQDGSLNAPGIAYDYARIPYRVPLGSRELLAASVYHEIENRDLVYANRFLGRQPYFLGESPYTPYQYSDLNVRQKGMLGEVYRKGTDDNHFWRNLFAGVAVFACVAIFCEFKLRAATRGPAVEELGGDALRDMLSDFMVKGGVVAAVVIPSAGPLSDEVESNVANIFSAKKQAVAIESTVTPVAPLEGNVIEASSFTRRARFLRWGEEMKSRATGFISLHPMLRYCFYAACGIGVYSFLSYKDNEANRLSMETFIPNAYLRAVSG